MNFIFDIETEHKKLFAEAANEARQKYSPISELEAYVRETGRILMQKQLDFFPFLVDDFLIKNKLARQEMEQHGHKGRFTDTWGWSEDGTQKFKYEIPKLLYLFMVNAVYKGFWEKDNEKISDQFLRRLLSGDDAMSTLMWVKSIYGANKHLVKTGEV